MKKNEVLEYEKKLEEKAKNEAENIVKEKKLENEKLKAEIKEIKKDITKTNKDEKNYKKLEKRYRSKCKKSFISINLYKVGTPEYKECILRKGIKIN